ncbi:MAG: 3-carboxy-cis,cis-muconate cycloisomerase, partial [Beijerinckiaceae bacterium]|nr:3-carboxy-cis,cis-muconate cycloisomerase [Beijerinckiaceae bacterium]
MSLSLNDAFATTPALAEAMSERRLIAGVFAFEAALARAQALEGVVPDAAARVIAACAEGMAVEPSHVAQDAGRAGALTIPLVKLLIAQTRLRDPSAAGFVHFGATSQDAMDTALVLQLDAACALIDADLARLANACVRLADAHRATIMTGRTLLQPATPIAFGQKAAQWLLAACEDRARLRAAAKDALRIQFGGASGNLGSLGDKGAAVSQRLSALLPLRLGADADGSLVAPWHTRRGALVNLAAALAITAGSAAKIARDVSLMAQWEIGEAAEPPEAGRGVSSAMPHKQNPVRCMAAIAAGVRVPHLLATLMSGMVQEHERALGGWQAEWAALPELVKASGGAVAGMSDALDGLIVDAARMRTNF